MFTYNANFTMTNNEKHFSITMNHLCFLPDHVQSRSQIVLSHYARPQCREMAEHIMGTDDVTVKLNVVNGVEYAY